MKCVLFFVSMTFVSNIFHSEKNSAGYHKFMYVFVQSTHYSCYILTKLEISWQIFEKVLEHQLS